MVPVNIKSLGAVIKYVKGLYKLHCCNQTTFSEESYITGVINISNERKKDAILDTSEVRVLKIETISPKLAAKRNIGIINKGISSINHVGITPKESITTIFIIREIPKLVKFCNPCLNTRAS